MGIFSKIIRRLKLSRKEINVFLVVAFLLGGLLHTRFCSAIDIAVAITVDTICGAVSLLIATNCSRDQHVPTATRFFALLAWSVFCYICIDLIGWIAMENQRWDLLQYIVDGGGVIIGYVSTVIFLRYVREFATLQNRRNRIVYYGTCALCILYTLAFLITLPLGLPFKIIDHIYVRGPLYALFQSYPIIALTISQIAIIRAKKLTVYEKASLSSYCVAPLAALLVQALHFGMAAISAAMVISLVIMYNNIYLQRSIMLAQQDEELTRSRVNMMVSQIQPHFLYNTLTSIANICEKEPVVARNAIVDFSDYLRVNLDSLKRSSPVPFGQELAHCQTYLRFEKMRFEEALNIEYDIETLDFEVPILSVQPLLENAVKHGICGRCNGGTVWLRTFEKEGTHYIEVEDDGVGFDAAARPHNNAREHIGLENVEYRIKQMVCGTMSVSSVLGEGTKITIMIPKREADLS